MRFLLTALCTALVLVGGGIASAHGGFESETEVRLLPDRMRIVTRTSLPFAWRILGDRAPATNDAAGQATARPLLAAAAAGLFEVSAGGEPLSPTKTDCVFEVHDLHDHAAFTLDFARPTASPVVIKATFFPLLGELDTGTIAVFDQSASRFQRDVEPMLKKALYRQGPSISFDLGPAKEALAPASPPATPTTTPPADTPARRPIRPWLLAINVAAVLIVGVLIARAAQKRKSAHTDT